MNTIRDFKRGKLSKVIGERTVCWIEKVVLTVIRYEGYSVRGLEDFYLGVLKTRWEYRDEYESPDYRYKKEEVEGILRPYPRFVKVSYNFRLSDDMENPIGDFDVNGMVIDVKKKWVVYPGMTRTRQLSDMDVIQAIADDPYLDCSVIVNPPVRSPLLTLFLIPGLDNVFVQYGTTSCVRGLLHSMESIPRFEDFIEPILDCCLSLVDADELEDVERLVRDTLFLMSKDMVLSLRCVNESGNWSIFRERMMFSRDGSWEGVIPGSPQEVWVDLCLESRYWKAGKSLFHGNLSSYVSELVEEWRGYGDETGRFVPIQSLRIIPEEVGVLGGWETFSVIFEPTYHFQNYVYETLYPSLSVTKKEHGDVLDGISFLGTPPSRRFGEAVDRWVEKYLSSEYGVWYHWKDVAFPIGQFWVRDESRYLEGIQDYAMEMSRNASGVLRSETNLYFCRRILSYYLCIPPGQGEEFEKSVAVLFAHKARLANVLHNQDLPCSAEITRLRKKFDHCRSLGARKFAVGKFVSELSWEDVTKIII